MARQFCVFGGERLPVTKQPSLGWDSNGLYLPRASFNAAARLWLDLTDNFKASARYEFRDRQGMGQLIALVPPDASARDNRSRAFRWRAVVEQP